MRLHCPSAFIPSSPATNTTTSRLHSETQLGKQTVQHSAEAYDKSLLSKIGSQNGSKPGPLVSSPRESPLSRTAFSNSSLKSPLKPLSMPDQRFPALDSPRGRWQSPSSAVSPNSSYRSPYIAQYQTDSTLSPRNASSTNSDANDEMHAAVRSGRSSVDQGVFPEPDMPVDENGMGSLNLQDRSPVGGVGSKGVKRRAESPPAESPRAERTGSFSGDFYHARRVQGPPMPSPHSSRWNGAPNSFSTNPSLMPSYGSAWTGSYASSATSFQPDRFSAGQAPSPMESDYALASPYGINRASNRSPQNGFYASIMPQVNHSKVGPFDARMPIEAPAYQASVNGSYTCECCLKKPKRFASMQDLR